MKSGGKTNHTWTFTYTDDFISQITYDNNYCVPCSDGHSVLIITE